MNPTIVSRAWYVHQTHKNVRKALLLVVCEMIRRLRTHIPEETVWPSTLCSCSHARRFCQMNTTMKREEILCWEKK